MKNELKTGVLLSRALRGKLLSQDIELNQHWCALHLWSPFVDELIILWKCCRQDILIIVKVRRLKRF